MDPTVIGLGSFLALALGAIAFRGDDDDDDDEQGPPPDVDPPVDEPEDDQPTLSDDGLTLTGTDEDDELVIDGTYVDGSGPATVLGGAGDDLVEGDIRSIRGGDGDDTINLDQTYGGTYYGDDGNDVITVLDANNSRFDGGDGNDTITATDTAYDEGNFYVGGAGDDVINVDAGFHPSTGLDGAPYFELGAGNDTVNLTTRSVGFSIQDEFDGMQGYLCGVTDFNPAEDILNLTIGNMPGQYQGLDVVESAEGTAVNVNFLVDLWDDAGVPLPPQVGTATVWMPNTFGVTTNSINVAFG